MRTLSQQPWSAPCMGADFVCDAVVNVPGSKSETNRALVLAALAAGPTRIMGGLVSRDSDLMLGALRQLGVVIDDERLAGDESVWRVTPPSEFCVPAAAIDCGLAGTVMRFVPPVAALNGGRTSFVGDRHASQRPMEPLLDGLAQLGVALEGGATGIPFTQDATAGLSGRSVRIDSSGSSQFVSALLLVAARLPKGVELTHVPAEAGASIPSRPHLDMTVSMLRARGVDVQTPDENTWVVAPGPIAAVDARVEPDLTSAAVFLAAAAVTRGTVRVPGWPEQTTQGGAAIVDLLRRAGASVDLVGDSLEVSGTGVLNALGEVDLHASSELTPVVAALAALAEGETRITGVAHIRGHETDRLAALTTELGRIGVEVEETEDGLVIRGRGFRGLKGAVWNSYADHRMAHAGALMGLLVEDLRVDDIACTTKTMADFPGLWQGMLT